MIHPDSNIHCSERTATCCGLGIVLVLAIAVCAAMVQQGRHSNTSVNVEINDKQALANLMGKLPF